MKIGRIGHLIASLLLVSCAARCNDGGGRNQVVPSGEAIGMLPAEPSELAVQESVDTPLPRPRDIPRRNLIQASRDACASPCPVFFDAISDLSWREIEASTFTWTFGDDTTSDGYMAAHVFELPEGSAKRTYEVTLVVQRKSVSIARDSHSVTVRPQRGRTICVAEREFSGCPSKRTQDHFTDVGAAWNAIQTNGRILFRRGDSFSPGLQLGSWVSGPVQVGAFGDAGAARPVIVQANGRWRLNSEWSLTDLDISGAAVDRALISFAGEHTLVMRSHIRDAKGAFTSNGTGYDFATHKFIINNLVTGQHETNYLAGSYIAVIGNRMERWSAGDHTMRIAGGKHVLVANNEFISDVGHSSLTVRGAKTNRPGSDYVLVQDNLLMQWASVHPQNATSNEWLRHVIWERNVHVPHDSQTSIQDGLSINGDDMVIRNNIFHQIRRAIGIEHHPLAGASNNIHIYHNTHFIDRDEDAKNWFCGAAVGSSGVRIQNNLAVFSAEKGGSQFIAIDDANAVITNNYGYTPGRKELCRRPGGNHRCTNPRFENTIDRGSPGFMRPAADSPAIDAAVPVPVSDDIHGTPRPQGAAPDVGAVELAK